MKNAIEIVKIMSIILTYLFTYGLAFASDVSNDAITHNHLKKRMTEKYRKIHDVSSTLQVTPHGSLGKLTIRGEMTPDTVPVVEGEHACEWGLARGS